MNDNNYGCTHIGYGLAHNVAVTYVTHKNQETKMPKYLYQHLYY